MSDIVKHPATDAVNGGRVSPTDELRRALEAPEVKKKIVGAMVPGMSYERVCELAARCLIRNPGLLKCGQNSILTGVAESAALGLDLDGVLGQAYLVPYGGEAKLVVGYKGLKELAYRAPKVAGLSSGVVHDGDTFEVDLGTSPGIVHKPAFLTDAPPTHYYAVGRTVDDFVVVEVMSLADVELHRNKYAKGHNRTDSAWKTAFDQMAKKTVLLKVIRQLPLSVEATRVVENSEYHETGQFEILPDGSVTPPEDLQQVTEQLGEIPFAGDPTGQTPEEMNER